MVTFNSTYSLTRVLQGIHQLDYPKTQLNLIFVDNASTDETLSTLREFQRQNNSKYQSIQIIERGIHDSEDTGEGRSICVDKGEGTYMLMLDSDALVAPQTLQQMLSHFNANKNVGEVQFLAKEPDSASRIRNMIVGMYVSKEPTHPYIGFTGGMHCVGIRMEIAKSLRFRRLGRSDDEDFHFRLRKLGYDILIDPTCRAEHLKPIPTMSSARIFYGYLVYLFWSLPRYHVPMFLSGSKPRRQLFRLSIYWILIGSIILTPFSIYPLLVSLFGYMLYEALRSNGIYRLLNPLFYPVFGVVYGSGMLREMIARAIGSLKLSSLSKKQVSGEQKHKNNHPQDGEVRILTSG